MSAVKPGADFDMMVFDTYVFTGMTLEYVRLLQKPDELDNQKFALFEEINSRIHGAKNYGGQIELSYPIRKYAEKYGHYYGILNDMHMNYELTLKSITIS